MLLFCKYRGKHLLWTHGNFCLFFPIFSLQWGCFLGRANCSVVLLQCTLTMRKQRMIQDTQKSMQAIKQTASNKVCSSATRIRSKFLPLILNISFIKEFYCQTFSSFCPFRHLEWHLQSSNPYLSSKPSNELKAGTRGRKLAGTVSKKNLPFPFCVCREVSLYLYPLAESFTINVFFRLNLKLDLKLNFKFHLEF